MGDSRFHFKATFEVYGQTFEWNSSLNWSAPSGECDERISKWFVSCYEQAKAKYDEEQYEAEAEQRKAAQEASERAQLACLKSKYPDAEGK